MIVICHAMVKIRTQVVGRLGGAVLKQLPGHSPGSPNESEGAGGGWGQFGTIQGAKP